MDSPCGPTSLVLAVEHPPVDASSQPAMSHAPADACSTGTCTRPPPPQARTGAIPARQRANFLRRRRTGRRNAPDGRDQIPADIYSQAAACGQLVGGLSVGLLIFVTLVDPSSICKSSLPTARRLMIAASFFLLLNIFFIGVPILTWTFLNIKPKKGAEHVGNNTTYYAIYLVFVTLTFEAACITLLVSSFYIFDFVNSSACGCEETAQCSPPPSP